MGCFGVHGPNLFFFWDQGHPFFGWFTSLVFNFFSVFFFCFSFFFPFCPFFFFSFSRVFYFVPAYALGQTTLVFLHLFSPPHLNPSEFRNAPPFAISMGDRLRCGALLLFLRRVEASHGLFFITYDQDIAAVNPNVSPCPHQMIFQCGWIFFF